MQLLEYGRSRLRGSFAPLINNHLELAFLSLLKRGVSVVFSSGDMGVGPYFGGAKSGDNVRKSFT